jgi:catalase
MALVNPATRVNYEPNSWGGELGGPRESPDRGFQSYPAAESGEKLRVRSETFADHYSQARQFYISQTPVEQQHIADSFTFELSKVETAAIRSRMVAHLLNVDKGLAETVGNALGLQSMPKPAEPARAPLTDLKALRSLSISLNCPRKFTGRKVGVLVSDGVESVLLKALLRELEEEGASFEVIAPKIGGVKMSDGSWLEAQQALKGGPSVLYDAVAILVSPDAAIQLAGELAARDFIADSFAHSKFVGYGESVRPLIEAILGKNAIDQGFVELKSATDVSSFIESCRQLRYWQRGSKLEAPKKGERKPHGRG